MIDSAKAIGYGLSNEGDVVGFIYEKANPFPPVCPWALSSPLPQPEVK